MRKQYPEFEISIIGYSPISRDSEPIKLHHLRRFTCSIQTKCIFVYIWCDRRGEHRFITLRKLGAVVCLQIIIIVIHLSGVGSWTQLSFCHNGVVKRTQYCPCCSDSPANLTFHRTLTRGQDPDVLELLHLG